MRWPFTPPQTRRSKMDYQGLAKVIFIVVVIPGMLFLLHLYIQPLRRPKLNTHYWAEQMLHLSWANDYISLNEIKERFSDPPQVNGCLLYLVNTDSRGQILDPGAKTRAYGELIGYYTNGRSFATAFLWPDGLDKDPECIHIGQPPTGSSKCKNLRLIQT